MAKLDSRTAGQLANWPIGQLAATFISIAITIAAAFLLLGLGLGTLAAIGSSDSTLPFVPSPGEANVTS